MSYHTMQQPCQWHTTTATRVVCQHPPFLYQSSTNPLRTSSKHFYFIRMLSSVHLFIPFFSSWHIWMISYGCPMPMHNIQTSQGGNHENSFSPLSVSRVKVKNNFWSKWRNCSVFLMTKLWQTLCFRWNRKSFFEVQSDKFVGQARLECIKGVRWTMATKTGVRYLKRIWDIK